MEGGSGTPERPSPGAYVVLYRRGEAWRDEARLGAQPGVGEHIANLVRLLRAGTVEQAGPFADAAERLRGPLVGLAVVVDRAAAEQLARNDPAVRRRVLEAEVLPWHR